jgi:hypothetical protein
MRCLISCFLWYTTLHSKQIKCLVETSGFTVGLARILATHSQHFSELIWLLDNSGSMAIGDGFRIAETVGCRSEGQRCTRWEELFETVHHHAEIASILQLPTKFRLLNYPASVRLVSWAKNLNFRLEYREPTRRTSFE